MSYVSLNAEMMGTCHVRNGANALEFSKYCSWVLLSESDVGPMKLGMSYMMQMLE
jgi:hypothetical protein